MKVGMARLRESGFLDSIMHSYMGPSYRAIPDHSANPLTVQLMVLGSNSIALSSTLLSLVRRHIMQNSIAKSIDYSMEQWNCAPAVRVSWVGGSGVEPSDPLARTFVDEVATQPRSCF